MLLLILVLNVVMFTASFTGRDAAARLVFTLLPAVLAVGVARHRAAVGYLVVALGALVAEQWLLGVPGAGWALLASGVASLVARLAPGLFLAYVAVVSTRVGELMAALERSRVPRQLVIPLAVVLRFLPTVREEAGAVATSMTGRGLTLGRVGPVAWLEYRMVPLMISTVRSGEELTQAALTRGLGRPGRLERINPVGFGPWDGVVALAAATGLGLWLL